MIRIALRVCGLLILTGAAVAQLPPPPSTAPEGSISQPKIFVEQTLVDLGTVPEGEKRSLSWTIENRGDAELMIQQIRSTCGCTIVKLPEEEKMLAPGKSLDIKAEFDSTARLGDQNKNVLVFTNDPLIPQLALRLKASVVALFTIDPPGLVNLRTFQRGESASRTIDIRPAEDGKTLSVHDVRLSDDLPLIHAVEPIEENGAIRGHRVRVSAPESAPLGSLTGHIEMTIAVDGVEQKRVLPLRGDIVGELTWTPVVLDAIQSAPIGLLSGHKLAPVTIRSSEKTKFDLLEVSAGSMLETSFERISGPPGRSAFSVYVTVAEGAAPGPFATMLEIRTTSLDQPWVGIPVFGLIAPPVQTDPPLILLRADGTAAGRQRRVKLMADPRTHLEVTEVHSQDPAVEVTVDRLTRRTAIHIQFLNVTLVGRPPQGRHESTLRIHTNVPAAKIVEIPVTIDVPAKED